MRLFGINFGKPTSPAPPVNGTAAGGHGLPLSPDTYQLQQCVTNLIEQGVIDVGAKNIWQRDYLELKTSELPKLSGWEIVKALGISEASAVCYYLPGFLLVFPLVLTGDLFRNRRDFAELSAGRRQWSQPMNWYHHAQAKKVETAIRKGLVEV